MKKGIIAILAATVYLTSFAMSSSAASNSPYDVPAVSRDWWQGYFTDGNDTAGDNVLQNDANDPSRSAHLTSSGGYDAIKPATNTAAEFIAEIKSRLNSTRVDPGTANNAQNWDRTGAAFIIQTMIGTSRTRPPSAAQVAEWEARVNNAAALGHINWGASVSYWPNTYYQINRGDFSSSLVDVAYYNNTGSGTSIIFYANNGSVAYVLRRQCANPLGTPAPLSDNVAFSISATSAVNDTTATPGQTVNFTHNIISNAATPGYVISWTSRNSVSGGAISSGSSGPFGGAGSDPVAPESFVVPTTAAAGTQFCRRIDYSPANQGGGSGSSSAVCTTVIQTHSLTPSVQPSASFGQVGDTVSFTYRITNAGPHTTVSALAVCKAVGKLHPPGSPLPAEFLDRSSDVGQTPPALTCPAAIAGNNTPVSVGTENITIPVGSVPGTQICRSLVINPYNTSGGTFRASAEACVIVAKRPYAHFGGNDVWAGGGYASAVPSCNTSAKIATVGRALSGTSPTEYAGSMVEYHAFALNQVDGFGSASQPLVGFGSLGSTPRSMTYGNNEGTLGNLGFYGAAQHCLVDYESMFTGATPLAAGTYNLSTMGSGTWYAASGTVRLTASTTIPAGVKQIIVSENNIFIDTDLDYVGSYGDLASIPSLIVIADANIAVDSTVSRLDGMYVAQGDGLTTGMFRDCWPRTSPQAVGDACDVTPLTINGAVIAGVLELWRSYGASGATTAARQTPAETFQFTPELYLRSALVNNSTQSVEVTNIQELPPRF